MAQDFDTYFVPQSPHTEGSLIRPKGLYEEENLSIP